MAIDIFLWQWWLYLDLLYHVPFDFTWSIWNSQWRALVLTFVQHDLSKLTDVGLKDVPPYYPKVWTSAKKPWKLWVTLQGSLLPEVCFASSKNLTTERCLGEGSGIACSHDLGVLRSWTRFLRERESLTDCYMCRVWLRPTVCAEIPVRQRRSCWEPS